MNTQKLIDVLRSKGFNPREVEGGTELTINCSLCFDDKQRLYISLDHGGWICFRCGQKGSLFSLLTTLCDVEPREVGVLVSSIREGPRARVPTVLAPAEASPVELPYGFIPIRTIDAAYGLGASNYLHERGVDLTLTIEMGIGYCLTGPYRFRVVVPVYTEGELRTWVARTWLPDEPTKVLMAKDSQASQALFGYDALPCKIATPSPCDHPGGIILVEGVFDALNMWYLGWLHTLATLGTHVTEPQRFLLKQKGFRHVILLRDGDEAGRKSAIKDAQRLQSPTLDVAIANLPDGTDPASASLSEIRTALEEAKPVELNLGTESMEEVHHG